MSLALTDQLPFKDVYLHAMVRDKEGRKMSKSLGNVIDPLEVIHGCDLASLCAKVEAGNLAAKEVDKAKKDFELDFAETGGIPKCGADALRIGLLAYTVQGRDINLDIKRVVGYRNFCNKIWQGCRFMLGGFGDFVPDPGRMGGNELLEGCAPRDKWVLSRLNGCVKEITSCFEEYEFGKAVQALEAFFKGNFCDVYIELAKPAIYTKETTPGSPALKAREKSRAVLWTCLDVFLRLLHPICPFVTEELWQRLPGRGQGALKGEPSSVMIAAWPAPVPEWASPSAEARMEVVLGAIEGARSLRNDAKLTPKVLSPFTILCSTPEALAAMEAQSDDFKCLTSAAEVTLASGADASDPAGAAGVKIVSDAIKVFLHKVDAGAAAAAGAKGSSAAAGTVDTSVQLAKLRKEVDTLAPLIKKLQDKMGNESYLTKVPEPAQAKDREKLAQYSKMHEEALSAIKSLE